MKKINVALIVGLLCSVSVFAELVTPVGVTASSYHDTTAKYGPNLVIDSSGLKSAATELERLHDEENVTKMWMTLADSTLSNHWIEFDLGAVTDVTKAYVWNYNTSSTDGNQDRGIKDFEIWVSSDGSSYSQVGTSYTLAASTPMVDNGVQVVDIATTSARYVKFGVLTNHGDADRVGLAEVRFEAIPEPATMGLLGFGGIVAFVLRKRLMA